MASSVTDCIVRKIPVLLLIPILHCLVLYETRTPPAQLEKRSVYFNEIQIRELSENEPISHDSQSPIWMNVEIVQLSETSAFSVANCIISGVTFTLLPCYAKDRVKVQYELRVPGTSIRETFEMEVEQETYVWMPFMFTDPGLELKQGRPWQSTTRAGNRELAAAVDRVNDQIIRIQNRTRLTADKKEDYPVLVLGASYSNVSKSGLNTLFLSLKNNSDKTIKRLILHMSPIPNRDPARAMKDKSPDSISAGMNFSQDIPGIHFSGPLAPGATTDILEFRSHYVGAHYPHARLDKITIFFSEEQSLSLEGAKAARLVFEYPLPPSLVVEDEESFYHFRL